MQLLISTMNREWARAVAWALLYPGDTNKMTTAALDSMRLWAGNAGSIAKTRDKDESRPVTVASLSGPMVKDIDASEGREIFCIMLNKHEVAILSPQYACPFCIFNNTLSYSESNAIPLTSLRNLDAQTMIDRLINAPIGTRELQAAAEAHNREMHSENGNTEEIRPKSIDRSDWITILKDKYWYDAVIETDNTANEKVIPTLYYARDFDQQGCQSATIAGTLHQYLCTTEEFELKSDTVIAAELEKHGLLDEGLKAMQDKVLQKSQNQSSPTPDPAQLDRDPDTLVSGTGCEQEEGETEAEALSRSENKGQNSTRLNWLKNCVKAAKLKVGVSNTFNTNSSRPDDIPRSDTLKEETESDLEKVLRYELLRLRAEDTRWIGVSIDTHCRQGKIEPTGKADEIIEFVSSRSYDEALTENKALYYSLLPLSHACYTAMACRFGMKVEPSDFKYLAIKVDLYDDLRERRITQPSGVDYAWADAAMPQRSIITLNRLESWSYNAVFIGLDVMEAAIRGSDDIQVNEGETTYSWSFNGHSSQVIPLKADGIDTTYGRDMWILSHLQYPLAWVAEHFTMYDIVMGASKSRRETFLRTAGLVNISNGESPNLTFVIPTWNSTVVLGGVTFNVSHADRYGRLSDISIPVVNVNYALQEMLVQVLNAPTSLREEFALYMPSSVNWLEINRITTALTVRWHQKIEQYRADNDPKTTAYAFGAPSTVLDTMGLVPDASVSVDSYRGYGGMVAVNGIDQRFTKRKLASVDSPIWKSWSNTPSLSVALGFGTYVPFNSEEPDLMIAGCRSSGIDRLWRGGILRQAFEMWKRSMGQTDSIAFPPPNEPVYQACLDLIYGSSPQLNNDAKEQRISSAIDFAHEFLTKGIKWTWDMNFNDKTDGSTLTGLRTISSWWRTEENTEWCNSSVTRRAYDELWHFVGSNYRVSSVIPRDNPALEAALCRLDMTRHNQDGWNLVYKTHNAYRDNKVPGLGWVVDSTYGGRLASEIGCYHDRYTTLPADKWGWGVAVQLRDYFRYKMMILIVWRFGESSLYSTQNFVGRIIYKGPQARNIPEITHENDFSLIETYRKVLRKWNIRHLEAELEALELKKKRKIGKRS